MNINKSSVTTREKILLLIPALWASIFDITITIAHQPKEYWDGNLAKGNEKNPIGALFMANHVSGIFIISMLWVIVITVMGFVLPVQLRKMFLLFCLIAHSFGASTWLSGYYGFWYAIIFMLFNSVLYRLIENYCNKHSRA